MRNPIIAAVLSLIVAGLGQIYNGQITKGVLFIVAQIINGALLYVAIGFVTMPLVGLWKQSVGTKHGPHDVTFARRRDLQA